MDNYTVKVVIRPNPTLALWFDACRHKAVQGIERHFKAHGMTASVIPEWVTGPYTGTQCCIGMDLIVPHKLRGNGYDPAPFWGVVDELGKPG